MHLNKKSPSIFNKVIDEIEEKIFDLDEHIKTLTNLFDNFIKMRIGGSAVVIGAKSSGKSTLIRKALFPYVSKAEVLWINGYIYDSDAAAIRLLNQSDNEMNQPHIAVIKNFENFLLHGDPIFLYKVLNTCRHQPLFVLLVSCRQDCREYLEKRARSRLSNICLTVAYKDVSIEKYFDVLQKFLHLNDTSDRAIKYNRSIKAFLKEKLVIDTVKSLYDESISYADLKAILVIFLCYLDNDPTFYDLRDKRCSFLFKEAKETIFQAEDNMEIILSSLTVRQLCILSCCVKIVRISQKNEFTYRVLAQSYHKFSRQYLSALNVCDDCIIFKELDTLSELCILEKKPFNGHLAFKTTSLQVDPALLINCFHTLKLPTAIGHWLDELENE